MLELIRMAWGFDGGFFPFGGCPEGTEGQPANGFILDDLADQWTLGLADGLDAGLADDLAD